MSSPKKLIAVIGATGAQGSVVIRALLEPGPNGQPSQYTFRALTRDPCSTRAQELARLGVELVKGSFMDYKSVAQVFEGAYGAFVNTDGSFVGEEAEIIAGMRAFELAKAAGIKHYVWGNLDYALKKGQFDDKYRTENYDGKGRVADWLKAQPSEEDGLTWAVLTSGPYMDMLHFPFFGPINKREDGTFVFASPVGNGHVAMVSLKDLGFFGRYIFDHRSETSGQDLEIASDVVSWPRLVETFTKVTGQKAEFLPLTIDEWFENFDGVDVPVGWIFHEGFEKGLYKDKTTFRRNFSGFWRLWRDDIVTRDMDWVRKINPHTEDVEIWMNRVGYKGGLQHVLKNFEDAKGNGLFRRNKKADLL